MRRLLPLLLVLAAAAAALADEVHLKDGRRLEGKVVKEDDKTITLEVAGDDPAAVEADVKAMYERLLANPVMEDIEVQIHP